MNKGITGTIELTEVDKAVAELNAIARTTPPKQPREVPAFVALAERLADAYIEAAQARLEVAQSQLESAKEYAAAVRAEAAQREKDMNDLQSRLEEAGLAELETHKRFHNGGKAARDQEQQ
jgi:hypothetical protein